MRPLGAVITAACGTSVASLSDGVVQPRKVEVDYPFGDMAVLRGVQAGERVVVEGKQNLKAGSHVRAENADRAGKAEPAKRDPT